MPTYITDYLNSLDLPFNLNDHDLIEHMIKAHIKFFNFSSINVILGEELSLEPEALFKRVINKRRGGYCFEHNKIFHLALKHLGFDVRPLIARVMLNGDPENGRSHRLTLLTLNKQQYIIDVGFGVMTPRTLIPLVKGASLEIPFAKYQVEFDESDTYRVIKTDDIKPVILYRLDLSESTETDCDISHFYSHKHKNAAFVNHLVVSRIEKNQRYLIRNLTFTHFDELNNIEHINKVTSANALQQILLNTFNINITDKEAELLFLHQNKYLTKLAA
ncbi:arylamine N-acetyltransferase family protein [Pseudoalteromonas denitrificans]|uniref:N-hydroxyarylamine O-acetyltransferase n=1 Tax=Pseudoalteromonas denitrificans DSM 6059 TaxID=1123010 RepID=A0A1I1RFD9_9GAMM|nr:arylamine N-acetyltransferase [Pseudoalteromonas denitrificans]SFD33015.1 N-hydroxyarylamine O-acetyltransferase [Pseudoalteromonas denitrificans DSM 6059]